MSELVDASLQFPTVVFTIGLGIVLVYWLFVLLGALDVDMLGHGHVDVDVGGVGADGGADVGGGDGGGHDGGDGDADGGPGGGGLWHTLGLGVVPLTISISVILLLCWVGCLLFSYYVVPDASSLVRGVLLPGTLIVSLPIASLLVRPLAPVFRIHEGKASIEYVGSLCTINTGHVDDHFGDATLKDDGNVLIIQVRCDAPGKLVRGDKALIIEFDADRKAFLVEPSIDMLPPSKA